MKGHRKSLQQYENARSIITALSGSWRAHAAAPPITPGELAAITPLLIQSGAGALLWWRIRDGELAKSDTGEQLRKLYRIHRLEASLHVARLKRAFQLFREAGIEPVLVKGWNVARLYPEPGLRHYFDLDLCVSHDCYPEANCLVASLGQDSLNVDLHDELDHLDVMKWDEFLSRSRLIIVDDTEVRVPCAEDHLRILCVHWVRHCAWRPAGFCDFPAALGTSPLAFDWEPILGADPGRADWGSCPLGPAPALVPAEIGEPRS